MGVDGFPERHDIPPSPVAITSVDVNFESAGFLAAKMLWDVVASLGTTGTHGTTRTIGAICPSHQSHSSQRSHPAATFGPLMVERRESTRGRGRRERFVLEATEAIRREACDGLTAERLAARFPVSRKHFERRFREATGHSVLDEILNIRLESVMAYLRLERDGDKALTLTPVPDSGPFRVEIDLAKRGFAPGAPAPVVAAVEPIGSSPDATPPDWNQKDGILSLTVDSKSFAYRISL